MPQGLLANSADAPFCQSLLAGARDPGDLVTRAIAGALTVATIHCPGEPLMLPGIGADRFKRMLRHFFPESADQLRIGSGGCRVLMDEEYEDIRQLLLDHRIDDSETTAVAASALAAACLGQNHLWQDLGMADRQGLSDLIKQHFPSLFATNTGNMRWKKFFYKQLCEREGLNLCRAPSCNVCCDYASCFGPETADVASWTSRTAAALR